MSYLDMALRAKKEESTQDNLHNLIDETIKKIEMVWSEGMLEWIKLNRPEGWVKVLAMGLRRSSGVTLLCSYGMTLGMRS